MNIKKSLEHKDYINNELVEWLENSNLILIYLVITEIVTNLEEKGDRPLFEALIENIQNSGVTLLLN